MNRFLIICAIALSLGGCAAIDSAGKSILAGGASVTASITNPVTPTMLYDVENGLVVAVSGLLAYKRACIAGAIPSSCRSVIATLQVYTRQARPALVRLRAFVRNNDQVNAIVAYNTVRSLLMDFQSTAIAAGVR